MTMVAKYMLALIPVEDIGQLVPRIHKIVLSPNAKSEEQVNDAVTELGREALKSRHMDIYGRDLLGAEIMLHFLLEGAE